MRVISLPVWSRTFKTKQTWTKPHTEIKSLIYERLDFTRVESWNKNIFYKSCWVVCGPITSLQKCTFVPYRLDPKPAKTVLQLKLLFILDKPESSSCIHTHALIDSVAKAYFEITDGCPCEDFCLDNLPKSDLKPESSTNTMKDASLAN